MQAMSRRVSVWTAAKAAGLAAAAVAFSGPASAVTTDVQAGPIQSITIIRGGDATSTNTGTFVDLPGATTKVKIKGKTLVAVRFSAESVCQGATTSAFCTVRVVSVKGGVETELRPDVFTDFAFDSGDNTDFWESHAMDRSIVLEEPGKYELKVQYNSRATTTAFRLDDWSMTVETAIPLK